MLKRLGIVLMALALVSLDGYSQAHKAAKTDGNQNPTLPTSPTGIKQGDSPTPQTKPDQHIQADVRIIQSPAKDRFDKAAFWISFVLALVGITGVGVGIATVLYIKRQAFEMGYQRIVMRRTLNAIRRQADTMQTQADDARAANTSAALTTQATLDALNEQATQLERQVKSSHDGLRAWIGVDVREIRIPGELRESRPSQPIPIYIEPKREFVWEMTNSGQTPAFIKSVSVSNVASATKDGALNLSRELLLNDFLGAGKSKQQSLTIAPDALGLCEHGQMFWRVAVKVGYEDAFSRVHETMASFHYYIRRSAADPLQQGFYQEVDPSTNFNT